MTKLTFHIQKQRIPEWLSSEIARSRVGIAKIMHPDQYAAPPLGDITYVGRLWFNGADNGLVYEGRAGADAWWTIAWPKLQKCPWCQIIEGPNEPGITTLGQAQAIADFERRRTDLLHRHNFESASYCFGVGNPDLLLWRKLGVGIGDYLALHEYGMKKMDWDGWHLGRYRFVLRELANAGYQRPRILLTETGIDYRGDPQKDGWRKHASEDEYVSQLRATSQEWDKDEAIIAAFAFTWNADGWPSFDHPQGVTRKLVDWMIDDSIAQPAIGDILAAIGKRHMIPMNYDAALMKAGLERGLMPVSKEYAETIAGVSYVAQVFARGNTVYTAYCEMGDWGNVHWVERGN